MTSETESLVLEILKRLQAQLSRLEEKVDGLGADLRGVKQHMAAFMTSDAHRDGEMASFKLRLERIERRLDIYEG